MQQRPWFQYDWINTATPCIKYLHLISQPFLNNPLPIQSLFHIFHMNDSTVSWAYTEPTCQQTGQEQMMDVFPQLLDTHPYACNLHLANHSILLSTWQCLRYVTIQITSIRLAKRTRSQDRQRQMDNVKADLHRTESYKENTILKICPQIHTVNTMWAEQSNN